MPNDKGFYDMSQPMKKTQPKQCGGYEGTYHGDAHDFNTKGKITKVEGSDYASLDRPDSGLHGNFAEKDAQIAYLNERNRKGQQVANFSATSREAVMKTGGGVTAYDSMPIPETYRAATSQGSVPPDAIQYKTDPKVRNENVMPDVNPSSTSLPKRLTAKIK